MFISSCSFDLRNIKISEINRHLVLMHNYHSFCLLSVDCVEFWSDVKQQMLSYSLYPNKCEETT